MTLPGFIVIGAGRCGTTSIHRGLAQHPDVFVTAEKSPNYFAAAETIPEWEPPAARAMASQWISDCAAYESLFGSVKEERAVGEVSPVYLQALGIPGRIRELCPDVKLVAILRDPVERAHADYLGRRRDGIEPVPTFEQRIERELAAPLPDNVAFGHYLGCGRYHHFLHAYTAVFERAQLRVFLYDDLIADPAQLMADLFAFLGVDSTVVVDMGARHNQSGEIRSPLKRALWTGSVGVRTRLRPFLPARVRHAAGSPFLSDVDRPPLDPALRSRLIEVFRADIVALEQLIGRDLAAWLRP